MCIVWETIYSFWIINRLYKIAETEQTIVEKTLSKIYFQSLDKQGLNESWWVRNFNLIFVLHIILMALLIFNLQYLQTLQVLSCLTVCIGIFVTNIVISRKTKMLNSKFEKIYRRLQECSFVLILTVMALFYFDSVY